MFVNTDKLNTSYSYCANSNERGMTQCYNDMLLEEEGRYNLENA